MKISKTSCGRGPASRAADWLTIGSRTELTKGWQIQWKFGPKLKYPLILKLPTAMALDFKCWDVKTPIASLCSEMVYQNKFVGVYILMLRMTISTIIQ